jgi:hypothetical protein
MDGFDPFTLPPGFDPFANAQPCHDQNGGRRRQHQRQRSLDLRPSPLLRRQRWSNAAASPRGPWRR